MEIALKRLCRLVIQRLLLIMGIMVALVVLVQLFALPYENYMWVLSHESTGTMLMPVDTTAFLNHSELTDAFIVHGVVNSTDASNLDEKGGYKSEAEEEDKGYDFASDDDGEMDNSFEIDKDRNLNHLNLDKNLTMPNVRSMYNTSSPEKFVKFRNVSLQQVNKSDKKSTLGEFSNQSDLQKAVSVTLNHNSMVAGNPIVKTRRKKPTSISDMTSLLLQISVSTNLTRPRWSSARDRELQRARLQIENAQIIRNTPALHASLFRNVSIFKRSYELMERVLKIYIYREGEKPIFHQPNMRGIYSSEGWFMKLMEGNKQFVVRDPKKAHLFYLPFSSKRLRNELHEKNFTRQMDLEKHLKNYVDTIAKRYRFWNRTIGADHFLVACHDWAPQLTRKNMGSCIRALCNSNVARDFKIGKDVSLPVTYVRTSQNPLKDLGGNPPSERPILAFFAGGIHGYLRPILLHYWNNKEPDMKVFGPMPRDIEGKTRYRELMKSSKYCICAKGYEVHTPRVVESIHYECVPVIISDNYVPPLFEVLDWEAFSVFIFEKDIPNLRNILLSIPEEKYLAMQHRVKMVQQHFLWHKKAVKYDLFHMILHSIWYNRVFQVKPG